MPAVEPSEVAVYAAVLGEQFAVVVEAEPVRFAGLVAVTERLEGAVDRVEGDTAVADRSLLRRLRAEERGGGTGRRVARKLLERA
ncbi:hypothetical protein ACPPVO_23515 [Dactylosporangium sp. McL0621]|uniref:hypothetical protein n=1 Tax=Dactylosporangium sp. McL0621 TaxID=3415678 RepID=UPI003CE84CC5